LAFYFEFLIRRRLVLNIIPFPVSTVKLIDKAREYVSALHLFFRFLYACANTIGPVICTPPVGEAQRIKKIHKNFLLALRMRRQPASPLSAGCNVAPITVLYNANTVGATSLVTLHLFFFTSPINWAARTGNGNMMSTR
jgi:hypothetical protein